MVKPVVMVLFSYIASYNHRYTVYFAYIVFTSRLWKSRDADIKMKSFNQTEFFTKIQVCALSANLKKEMKSKFIN